VEQPRLLIEEWLPAAAIGVECMRERGSASALAPTTFLHVWWARRPLTVSRAAVLASLLPADFPRDVFERLLGFGIPSEALIRIREQMDLGVRVDGGFGTGRAFSNSLFDEDLECMRRSLTCTWAAEEPFAWTGTPTVIDPMSGGGSIPLEACRLGLNVFANELNPVACTILEATVGYPFRWGGTLVSKTKQWGARLNETLTKRLGQVYPRLDSGAIQAYLYTWTVRDPNTPGQPYTPLVPDWHLAKVGGKAPIVACPVVEDPRRGKWSVEIRTVGNTAGDLAKAPPPTYKGGKGFSLFQAPLGRGGRPTGPGPVISPEWIKAEAQAGRLRPVLYAVAYKTPRGLEFRPPLPEDLEALERAERELERLRPQWERTGVLPTERIPVGQETARLHPMGLRLWTDLFTPRQLLAMGVLVEELNRLRPEIVAAEGEELGEAVVHLLALGIDKFADYNNRGATWENTRLVCKHIFQRHDYAFKPTFAEMAACGAGAGLEWAMDNVIDAYAKLAELARSAGGGKAATITQGSATHLAHLADRSVEAVVVDPPYDDNVQYSELADFFYVWLKRTQGHRRPEWFGSYLCDHTEEAVVNPVRHQKPCMRPKEAEAEARAFYRRLMLETFREARRVLRDDGALTVMFTHKKQEAWEALFGSILEAGFRITATWPIKTESEHSLHQARKNSAQSTVLLTARKRDPGAGVGYFELGVRDEIVRAAREAAERLEGAGLNPVDQLVGAFGPAMEVFSRYAEVRTSTGGQVAIGEALAAASDAVLAWRVERLRVRTLQGVSPESRFALLFWDVLGAEEVRFNEVKLLGHAAGMDPEDLVRRGLLTKTGDKMRMLPAAERRRAKALTAEELLVRPAQDAGRQRATSKDLTQVHPNDGAFRSEIDACHALALAYLEAGEGAAGIGAAKSVALRARLAPGGKEAALMEALVKAAPKAVRFRRRKGDAADRFPEFRAWHALLHPLFGVQAPEWKAPAPAAQGILFPRAEEEDAEPQPGAPRSRRSFFLHAEEDEEEEEQEE